MSEWYWIGALAIAIGLTLLISSILTISHQGKILSKTSAWLSALRNDPTRIQSSFFYRKRILVFVNPYSGSGKSQFLYENMVEPILTLHEAQITLVQTQYANHAAEYMQDPAVNLSNFDAVLLISGDGLLSEMLNGLVQRYNKDGHLSPSSPSFHAELSTILHKLPVCLLPGGTSNGLVTSLFGPGLDEVDVFRKMVVGKPRSVDIMSIETPVPEHDSIANAYSKQVLELSKGQRPVFKVDMLTFLYGAVADNDHFAERTFRCLPSIIRTTLAPLLAILLNRTYPATIRIKPLPFSSEEQSKWHYTDATKVLPAWQEDSEWRVMDNAFTSFVILNQAWPAADVFMAPSARPDDGAIYACVIRKENVSICSKLYIFLQLSDGSHNSNPHCEFYKLSQFVVHPRSDRGNMIISGEALKVQSIAGKVQPKAAYFVF